MRRAFRRTTFSTEINGALEKRNAPYGTVTRNQGAVWESEPSSNSVIPSKAGIQNLWIPGTLAKAGLGHRLRGYETEYITVIVNISI